MAGNLFDLNATLRLDKSSFESGVASAGASMEHLSTGMIAKGTIIAHAIEEVFRKSVQAITGFVGSAIQTGADFDKSMSQVAATLGLSMDEMMNTTGSTMLKFGDRTVEFSGNLRDFAQVMGENTKFTAKEAADALNYMALAGYNTQESMEMLPTVLNMAAAGNMDLAKASDMVTDTQKAYGLSFERTTKLTDEMAKAASTGNTSVEQLGEAFLRLGGLGREVNGGMVKLADGTEVAVDGVTDLSIAFTAMANSGVKGSEAGTKMRNMITKLSKPTKQGALALQEMNVQIFDAEGKMRPLVSIFGDLNKAMSKMTQEQKIKTVSSLFNARDLASAQAVLNAIEQDWDKIGSSIIKAEGAASKMANTQLDNLAGDVTIFKSALDGTRIAISDGVTPALRGFVQKGTEGLGKLTNHIKKMNFDKLGKSLEKLADSFFNALNKIDLDKVLSDAVNAVANFVNFISNNFDTIITVVTNVGKAFIGWKIVSIVGDVVGALGGLISIFPGLSTAVSGFIGLCSPWLAGLTAVAGGIAILIANMDNLSPHMRENMNVLKQVANANAEVANSLASANGMYKLEKHAIKEQAKSHNELVKELKNHIDSNGKVIESDKERVQFILDELNDALGTSISMNDLEKGSIDDITKSLYDLIAAQEIRAEYDSYMEAHANAIQNQATARESLKNATEALASAEKEYNLYVGDGTNLLEGMNLQQTQLSQEVVRLTEEKQKAAELLKQADQEVANSSYLSSMAQQENWGAVRDGLNRLEEGYNQAANTIYYNNQGIVSDVSQTTSDVTNKTTNAMKNISGEVYAKNQGICSDVKNTSKDVNTTTQNGVRDVKDILNGGLDETQLMVRKKAAETGEEFHEIPKHADIFEEMIKVGENVVKGFIEGFQRLIDGAIRMVRNAFASITGGVEDDYEIESPSKVFKRIGGYVAQGFGIGFQDKFDGVKKDISDDMKSIMDFGKDDIQLGNISYSSAHNANASRDNANSKLESMMGAILNKLDGVGNQQIVLDTGVLVGQTVSKMDYALGGLATQNERGVIA